jgi:hypothetical protein
MLKTILGNQELIMKALKIEVTVKKTEKAAPSKKVVAKKATAKKVVGKPAVKKVATK